MPEERDLDQPDRTDTPLDPDDDVVGIGESDDDLAGIGESDDEFEDVDDEEYDEEPRGLEPTAEVGSEGGSPGESLGRSRSRVGAAGGTEATETWQPTEGDRRVVDKRDRRGVPVRRSPV